MSKRYEHLKNEIRSRVILQYFRPYLSVSLEVMANALAITVDDLETECARLINEKKLLARIDSQQKVLKSKETDQRTVTYQKVMDTGDLFVKNMHTQLLSLSLIQHDFVHRTRGTGAVGASARNGGGPGGSGGGSGGSSSSENPMDLSEMSSGGYSGGMSKQDGGFF